GLVSHDGDHRVAGAVRDVAGAPPLGTAEIALGQEPVRLVALGDLDLLPVDDDLPIPLAHAAPRHAPGGQLAHRLGRGVDEHAHDLLIGGPVAAAHRVLALPVLLATPPFDD